MSQLIQLRQRINSIKKTSKITRAMRLMSMSLYTKLEKQNVAVSRYQQRITTLFRELSNFVPDWKNPILFPEDILDSSPLFVLISSSKGLCGSFNNNLMRHFEKTFFLENHQNPRFITVGTKAHAFLKRKNFGSIVHHEQTLNTSNIAKIADNIAQAISLHNPNFSSVTFYCNELKNFFIQTPNRKEIIPLPLDITTLSKEKVNAKHETSEPVTFGEEPLWEQDQHDVMNHIGAYYLKSMLLDVLIESLLAEHAARFMAMDHSTTNAEKYLEKLTLQYNKLRQSHITRELAELSASFADLGD